MGKKLSIVFLILLSALLGFFLFQSKEEHSSLQNRLYEIIIEKENYKNELDLKVDELNISNVKLRQIQSQYHDEREAWLAEKSVYEEEYAYMTNYIDSLFVEKNKIEVLLSEQYPTHSRGYIEELLNKRNEYDALIKEERKHSSDLATHIADMEVENRKNDEYIVSITEALFSAYDFLVNITDNEQNIESTINQNELLSYNTSIDGQNPFISIDLESQTESNTIEELYNMIDIHRSNLNKWRYHIENIQTIYNEHQYTLKANQELGKRLEVLTSNLLLKEKKIEEYKFKLNTRYLLIKTTSDLYETTVVQNRRWKRDQTKRGVDLTKVNPKEFLKIKYDEVYIELSKGTRNIRSLITPHPRFSYEIEHDKNRIRIFDKEQFWKATFFVLIETE